MSRHRRHQSRPTPNASSSSPTLASTDPSPLSASTTNQQEAHRLAVIEIDNGGSVGSALTLFEHAAATVDQQTTRPRPSSVEDMHLEAGTIRREIEAATALAGAALALRDAEVEAAALRRRLIRSIGAERRRLDHERRRAEGGLYAGQPRSDNRPTRLAVDPDAWEVLKGEAIRQETTVGYLAGQLVIDAVRHSVLPKHSADGSMKPRFARLVLVDTETWIDFRTMAFDAHVTTTRMLGVLVEAEARRLASRRAGRKPAVWHSDEF